MRIKLIIISISTILLVIITLLQTSFYAKHTYTEWRNLTWDDFKGFPVLFTGWGAAISSNVFTKYDSINRKYNAYSMMNNQKSWKKLSFEGSDYTLNHEQYHFNLTESFARLLNKKIDRDSLSKEELPSELSEIRQRVRKLQKQYDEQSDHGLNRDMQRYWEFKIDSMMVVHDERSGYLTDYLTEATIFLPTEFEIYAQNVEGYAYRMMGNVNTYDMSIVVYSRSSMQTLDELKESIRIDYKEDSLMIIKSIEDTTASYGYELVYDLITNDSSKLQTDNWISKYGFLHLIRVVYPNRARIEGYKKIRNSVINSFDIINSNQYWISKLDSSDDFHINQVTQEGATREEYENMDCWVNNSEEGFEHGIFSNLLEVEDGYILPYDVTGVKDSLIKDLIVIANNELQVVQSQESFEEFFFIPKSNADVLELAIGYSLKEDTSQVCYQFYSNTIGFVLND